MRDPRGPELVILELGRLARFGEPKLCAEEIICVLDEALEIGVKRAVLEVTGPLRPDDLVLLASSAAKRIPLVTVVLDREWALEASVAEELSDVGVSDVAVPMRVFDDVGQVSRETIDLIRDEGIGVRAIAPAWPGLSDLSGVAARVVAIGVTRLQLNVNCGTGRCALTSPMLERLARSVVDVARAGTLAMIVTELPLVRRIAIETARAAREGAAPPAPIELDDSRSTMRISRAGDVLPSRSLPIVAGNVRRQRLDGIWGVSKLYTALRDRERLVGRCGGCAWREICGGSRARAWQAGGDYFGEDPACSLPMPRESGAARLATA